VLLAEVVDVVLLVDDVEVGGADFTSEPVAETTYQYPDGEDDPAGNGNPSPFTCPAAESPEYW
jgi:hypothetical protein